jgi:hypothetical protein
MSSKIRINVMAWLFGLAPAALIACNSIWGIQDGEYAPPAGTPDASAGSAGSGGSSGAAGYGQGGAGGVAGQAGSSAGASGNGGQSGAGGTGQGGADGGPLCDGSPCDLLWLKRAGDATDGQFSLAISANAQGRASITGRYLGVLDIGPDKPLNTTYADSDVFSAQYDHDGNPLWSFGYPAALYQYARAIHTFPDGSVVFAGHYKGALEISGLPDAGVDPLPVVPSTATQKGFVARVDANGQPVWAKPITNAGYSIEIRAISCSDTDGYCVVVGNRDQFTDASDQTSQNLIARRFDALGNQTANWDSSGSADSHSFIPRGVAVDPWGTTWISGGFFGTFKPVGCSSSVGSSDIAILRYTSDGTCVPLLTYGDAQSSQVGEGIAVDHLGAATLCGSFEGSLVFSSGAGTLSGPMDPDYALFVAHFGASGTFGWAKKFGTTMNDMFFCRVAVDGDDNIYVAGHFNDSVSFGGDTFKATGQYSAFLAKLDKSGNHLWSKAFTTDAPAGTDAIGVSIEGLSFSPVAGGRVFTTGFFAGNVDFGNGLVQSAGNADIFVATFRP